MKTQTITTFWQSDASAISELPSKHFDTYNTQYSNKSQLMNEGVTVTNVMNYTQPSVRSELLYCKPKLLPNHNVHHTQATLHSYAQTRRTTPTPQSGSQTRKESRGHRVGRLQARHTGDQAQKFRRTFWRRSIPQRGAISHSLPGIRSDRKDR